MPHAEIDGVPVWYEEHVDPTGPPLAALHGGLVTFRGSFGDVLPWLTEGRRVIGAELQGHGHTADTGRALSIERFAADVAELIDRVADSSPVDVWASSSAPSPPRASLSATPPRSAASCSPPRTSAPTATTPRSRRPRRTTRACRPRRSSPPGRPTTRRWHRTPADFFPFLDRTQPVVHDFAGWTADEIRSITAPTFLVVGDRDFVYLDPAAEMHVAANPAVSSGGRAASPASPPDRPGPPPRPPGRDPARRPPPASRPGRSPGPGCPLARHPDDLVARSRLHPCHHPEGAHPAAPRARGRRIVTRTVHDHVPPKVACAVSDHEQARLPPVVDALCEWGLCWCDKSGARALALERSAADGAS